MEDVKERELNKEPEFFESITNNAIKSIIDGKYNVYDNIFRLVGIKDTSTFVPKATIDGLGNTVPSQVTITESHNVINNIPLVFSYKNTYFDGFAILFSEPEVGSSTFTSQIISYDVILDYTFDIRFYVFELLTKIDLN